MGAGSIILNQPGVYLVDVDGNAITVTDGLAIGSAEAVLIAGKDGSNARFIRVATDGTVRIDPTGTTTQPISAASLPLPTGAATAALQTQPGVDIGDVTVNNAGGAAAVNIQDGGNSITVDGPLTDAQLRASAVPISAASLPLPTGAATEATLALIKAKTDNLDVALSTRAVTGLTDAQLRATPVPVSGPLTDTQLRASAVAVSAASLPLPTGAATAALQTQPGVDIGDVTINNGAAAAAVNIQDGGNSITVDASSWPLPTGAATETTLATLLLNSTFNSRINTLGQKVMASSTPVVIASDQSTLPISAASLPLPTGAATAANQTTLGSQTTKLNDGTTTVTVKAASTAAVAADTALVVAISPNNSVAITAASLPLPTGAATSALQTTGNTSISNIDTKTPALGQAVMASSTPVVIASNQSTLPISAASLPLPTGAATAALQTQPGVDIGDVTINNAAGASAVNIQDGGNSITVDATSWPLPTGAATSALQTTGNTSLSSIDTKTPTQGQTTMAASSPVVIASDQSAVASKNAAASQVDGHSATIGTTTDADTALTVIGRLKQIITKLAAGLPAALVGGRLDQNMGSWFGSTVPTVGQKPMAQSIPVVMGSDQTAVLVTFTGTRTGVVGSIISLGGSTAGVLQIMRATAYAEQGAQAQRSFKSDNVNDASAGTGARTVKFIYYDNAGAGPFTETVTLNGTTAVATVATDIRFIESMEVITSGSGGANAGTITMYVNNSGGGGTIGSIGVSSIVSGAGDNRTLWAHHYVATGVTASLSTLIVGAQSGGSGTSARFFVKAQSVLVANSAETLVGDVLLVQGAFSRLFNFYVKVPGFSRLTAYGVPAVNNATLSTAFDYSET